MYDLSGGNMSEGTEDEVTIMNRLLAAAAGIPELDLTCADCGATGPDVVNGPCPYNSEINYNFEHVDLCPSCYHERAADI